MFYKCAFLALGFALATVSPAAPPQKDKKPARAPRPAAKGPGAAAIGEKSGLNKQHLEAYVRHLYGWPPDVKVDVADFTPSPIAGLLQTTVRATYQTESQDKVFYVSSDGKYVLDGSVYTASDNPFRAALSKLTTSLQPSFGSPGASVVVVAFSDFQCPHCRDEAKALRENLLKTYPTQVRLYFKDFPLLNHDWARPAAIAGRCIFRQNPVAFWDYHDWVFDKQGEITAANLRDKLTEFLQGKEIDPLQLNRCLDQQETAAEVDKSIVEGKSLQVTSTPTLFVNGRRLPGATLWPNLKVVIDQEIEYQKTAKDAGEQECCEVKLPNLFTNK
jgi:protein-disulfide isomerase